MTTAQGHALYDALTDDRVSGCYDGQTDALYAYESSGAIIVWSRQGLDLAARARKTATEVGPFFPETAEALDGLADALEPFAELAAHAAEDANLAYGDVPAAAAEAAADAIRGALPGATVVAESNYAAGWVRLDI